KKENRQIEFPQFPSWARKEFFRQPKEMTNKTSHPEHRHEYKSSHHFDHRDVVEAAVRRKVRANCQKGAEENNEQDGAAEPSHLRANEAKCCLAASRCQPVSLVRKIDLAVGARGYESRRKESDHAGQSHHRQHHQKKIVLGLPPVGNAVEAEMRCHSLRQPGIVTDPLKKPGDEHDEVNSFGETRIVHGFALASD